MFRESRRISAQLAAQVAVDYRPQAILTKIPEQAEQTHRSSQQTDFSLAPIIKEHTGLKEREKEKTAEEVEQAALAKLQEVQEKAYQEAYDLGLEEGRKKAFDTFSVAIEDQLKRLEELVVSAQSCLIQLGEQNERRLIELAHHIGARLAYTEINTSPDATLALLKSVLEVSQQEDEVAIEVHPEQIELIESLQQSVDRNFEFLKKAKFVGNPQVSYGGCILVSKYGEVDARFEEKVKKMWDELTLSTPSRKDSVAS